MFFGFVLILFQSNVYITPGISINKELGLATMTWPLIILITIGAIAGDFIGSFSKRRFGLKRGASVPLLDQLGFVICAILFALPLYTLKIESIIFLIIITPIIHLFSNYIAYKIKVKSVPW